MRKKINGHRWRPLERAFIPESLAHSERAVALQMERTGGDREAAIRQLEDYEAKCEYWRNDLYQVQVRRLDSNLVHLNIRRIDGAAMVRDWRHFQQIKNELLGEECEAIELYPAESRKVDTSNKYHLWGVADPEYRFPIGFDDRDVLDDSGTRDGGTRQRKL